jgi:hypothetical protein
MRKMVNQVLTFKTKCRLEISLSRLVEQNDFEYHLLLLKIRPKAVGTLLKASLQEAW